MKMDINNYRNLARINTVFHRHLHRNLYYVTINELVKKGYKSEGKNGVMAVVSAVKTMLLTISNCCF